MISTPGCFTNYKLKGCGNRCHHTEPWLIGQLDYDP
jgi:hypothetical protein